MTGERWQRLSALFDAAAELGPERRAAYLAEACGDDPGLRQEVESLLAAQERAGEFLERPPTGAAAVAAADAPQAPVLTAGQRLGHYEIVALLGAGGMGQVYRARDPRLGREVAIKVLPAGLEQLPDRVRRFEQEARAAGGLDHPNILAVHDVGTHAGMPYLVTELLAGETLRARLDGRPLPWRKAAEIAAQVARGLAAAHAHGIVHRDLKPENVFLTRDGRVKLLDFGLAKLTQADGGPHTQTGFVLGTAGYMSPEQVRGEAVDGRSDLFALAAILYEMLAGEHPFRRGSVLETLAAIVDAEPPDLAALQPGLPVPLVRLVRRGLERRPDERFQSASDLAFQLESLAGGSEGTVVTAASSLPPAAGPPSRDRTAADRLRRRPGLWAGAAALALAAAAFVAGRALREPAAVPSFRQLTFRRGTVESARFAPDGATVLYTAAWDGGPDATYSMRLDTLSPRALPLPPARVLAVGAGEVALLLRRGQAAEGTLARAPLDGGAPREVLEGVLEADWWPQGDRFAVVRQAVAEARLEYPIGTVLHRAVSGNNAGIGSVRIAPDGDRVAFVEFRVVDDTRGSIAVADARGVHTLSSGWADLGGLAWSPDGEEVWFTAAKVGFFRSLWAVGLDGRTRLVARTPAQMVLEDVFRDGRLLFTHIHDRSEVRGVAPGDPAERDLSWFDWTHANDLSRDGRRLLFTEEGEEAGAQLAVYLRQTTGDPSVRLGAGHATALSPDGRWAIAHLRTTPPPQLVLLPTGPGTPRPLPRGTLAELHWAWWLPDGRRLLVLGNEAGRPVRLFLQPVRGGAPRPAAAEGVTTTGQDPVAPDGRTVVVQAPGLGAPLGLLDLANGALRPLRGSAAGDEPIRWSGDGRALFVKAASGAGRAARLVRLEPASGRRTPWKELQPPDAVGLVGVRDVLLTPDGATYAYSYRRSLGELHLAEGVR